MLLSVPSAFPFGEMIAGATVLLVVYSAWRRRCLGANALRKKEFEEELQELKDCYSSVKLLLASNNNQTHSPFLAMLSRWETRVWTRITRACGARGLDCPEGQKATKIRSSMNAILGDYVISAIAEDDEEDDELHEIVQLWFYGTDAPQLLPIISKFMATASIASIFMGLTPIHDAEDGENTEDDVLDVVIPLWTSACCTSEEFVKTNPIMKNMVKDSCSLVFRRRSSMNERTVS